ncbi:hypothetical protein JW766_00725 [Candidatus Dojkabacteria bacterium]|nr:hypothetical protein [Candidatus Dojkabacteria bacterium]
MSTHWTCPKCGRIFAKKNQMHSCKKFPIEKHFEGKEEIAKPLFEYLKTKITTEIGPVKVISLPCCIHLFGCYDFIAILPKKDRIEVRFAWNEKIKNKRIDNCVPMSKSTYKICLDVRSGKEIDKELMGWLKESYNLKG